MRLRDVKGKRIVAIGQSRFYSDTGQFQGMSVDRIVLDDGTVLCPGVYEGVGDYGTPIYVYKPEKAEVHP